MDHENIQSRYRDVIRHRKMRHVSNEKQEMIHNRRNRTIKSRKKQNARRKGNLQIFGNIGSWHHQTSWDERKKIKKEYLWGTGKQLEIKLFSKNLMKGINTLAVPLVRYSGPFLKWTREDEQMNLRTRKLMTVHKALHPRDDVDRL